MSIESDANAYIRAGRKKNIDYIRASEQKLLNEYNNTASRIAEKIARTPENTKRLQSLYDDLEKELDRLNRRITDKVYATIDRTVREVLVVIGKSSDVYTDVLVGGYTGGMSKTVFDRIHHRTMASLFSDIKGIELSDKIWELHKTTLIDMRAMIARELMAGSTWAEIAQKSKAFLALSTVDMRRKIWKEFFKTYKPGRGVYKSAYKNVQRLLRTEWARASRHAMIEYARDKEWIQGLEWHRVSGCAECAECQEYAEHDEGLGTGVFLASTLPESHPNCQCYVTFVAIPALLKPIDESGSLKTA